MSKKFVIKVLFIGMLAGIAAGLTSCSGSSNGSSSGGGTGPGGGPGHDGPGNPVMVVGQQIPRGQEVHIHDSGFYPVSVPAATTMSLECDGRVEYSYTHGGQVENGVCENQTLNIPIPASGTLQFNLGQGADMGLELHN